MVLLLKFLKEKSFSLVQYLPKSVFTIGIYMFIARNNIMKS